MATQSEYFDYLVKLRDSGITNMWGAAPYVASKFGVSKQESEQILFDWIGSFNRNPLKKMGEQDDES
jgi:hypothetical protein